MTTAYRVPVMENFSWQDPAINMLSAQPVGPITNARYIVGATATGVEWEGKEGKIAWFNGTIWKFDTPSIGWRIFNKADSNFYTYLAEGWSGGLTVGDLTITGSSITSTSAVDWNVIDDNASGFEFKTATDVSLINLDTTNNNEVVTIGVDLKVAGSIIDFTNDAKTINIGQTSSAVSFNSTSAIMSIDATNGAEIVNVYKSLTVAGNLTVNGTTTTVNTEELLVTDKRITLNNNGTDVTMRGAGIEVAGDTNQSQAYFKLSETDTTIWELMGTNNKVLTIDVNDDKTFTIAGDLTVESGTSAINQDVTSDASPSFSNLTLNNGTVTISADSTSAFAIYDSATTIFKIDSSTAAKKVVINSGLVINVGDITMKEGGTIIDTEAAMTLKDHNDVSVTVLEAFTAYEDRAQYDSALRCIVFPASLDTIV